MLLSLFWYLAFFFFYTYRRDWHTMFFTIQMVSVLFSNVFLILFCWSLSGFHLGCALRGYVFFLIPQKCSISLFVSTEAFLYNSFPYFWIFFCAWFGMFAAPWGMEGLSESAQSQAVWMADLLPTVGANMTCSGGRYKGCGPVHTGLGGPVQGAFLKPSIVKLGSRLIFWDEVGILRWDTSIKVFKWGVRSLVFPLGLHPLSGPFLTPPGGGGPSLTAGKRLYSYLFLHLISLPYATFIKKLFLVQTHQFYRRPCNELWSPEMFFLREIMDFTRVFFSPYKGYPEFF